MPDDLHARLVHDAEISGRSLHRHVLWLLEGRRDVGHPNTPPRHRPPVTKRGGHQPAVAGPPPTKPPPKPADAARAAPTWAREYTPETHSVGKVFKGPDPKVKPKPGKTR